MFRVSYVTCCFLVCVGVVAGCSSAQSGAPPSPPGTETGVDGGSDATFDETSAYPSGPFGGATGETLADVVVSGYRLSPAQTDSTKLTWETNIRLADFHNNAACKCLYIAFGGRWCGACRQEQATMIEWVNKDPAFCVLGILQDGMREHVDATRDDVDLWTQEFRQNFTVVAGNSKTWSFTESYRDKDGNVGMPISLVVKPSTMKVVGHDIGTSPLLYNSAVAECKK